MTCEGSLESRWSQVYENIVLELLKQKKFAFFAEWQGYNGNDWWRLAHCNLWPPLISEVQTARSSYVSLHATLRATVFRFYDFYLQVFQILGFEFSGYFRSSILYYRHFSSWIFSIGIFRRVVVSLELWVSPSLLLNRNVKKLVTHNGDFIDASTTVAPRFSSI